MIVHWNSLSHPNVLKLVGVQGNVTRGPFVTVSEWMTHRNIMEYTENNSVNRLELVLPLSQLHVLPLNSNYSCTGRRMVWNIYMVCTSLTVISKGLVSRCSITKLRPDAQQANILITNDTRPRACLADFGFMPMILDPSHPMACSTQIENDTMRFMSPELLVPSESGMRLGLVPTQEADIYAFGLVTFQVCELDCRYGLLGFYLVQVLTGEIPFRGVQQPELGYSVVQGLRPTKPENAPAIGFSESLWSFVQLCWNGKKERRPEIAEVARHLGEAAANWHGVMSPRSRVKITNPPLGGKAGLVQNRKLDFNLLLSLLADHEQRNSPNRRATCFEYTPGVHKPRKIHDSGDPNHRRY
jgi:serine/threonine protein kinase